MKIELVKTDERYDYYRLTEYDYFEGRSNNWCNYYWNIVPKGSPAPTSGYLDRSYIEKIKNTSF